MVDAHLARIEATNPTINAVTRVLADEARAAAAAADRAVVAGDRLGPLHGVPCTVKQNIDQTGCATNWGLPALADAVPPVDSPVVERMRAAGAIPIARTNCPDMALRIHTDSALFGVTRNPWNLERTAGGSSGGEGAACRRHVAHRPRQRHRRLAAQPGDRARIASPASFHGRVPGCTSSPR